MNVHKNSSSSLLAAGVAGAVASLLTQPLEVFKTNRINSPALIYRDLHMKIIEKGWSQYMRGSTLAVIRQAYGFSAYIQLLSMLQNQVHKWFPSLNKFVNYSVSSVAAKLSAMVFEAPLTLLKTRVQCVSSVSIWEQIRFLSNSPLSEYVRGLGSSLVRQSFYTLFHYSSYRYLKDDFFKKRFNKDETFIPAFVAGVIAITVSQPFEVLRNQVSLNKTHESALTVARNYLSQFGLKGCFFGYLPRLIRKPINSGICWTILQGLRQMS